MQERKDPAFQYPEGNAKEVPMLDPFLPNPDIRERHEITVRAPAALVLATARHLDMQSLPLVRLIFWLRSRFLGARAVARTPKGLVEETRELGWGVLAEVADRAFVAGAVCQPWRADVVFTPLSPEGFAAFAEPGYVKIAWTLEAEPLGPERTRFATETRAAATDVAARRRFLRYWRFARFGIVAIRLLLLPALRRQAERERRNASRGSENGGA